MIDQITKEVIAKKQAGAFKVRVILWTSIKRDGKKIPQVMNISEFETVPAILKSGKLASPLRVPMERCKGKYESFTVEVVK
jgi:hypothetical protein